MALSGTSHYLTSDRKLCYLFNMSLNTVLFHEVFLDSSSLTLDLVPDMYATCEPTTLSHVFLLIVRHVTVVTCGVYKVYWWCI